MFIIVSVLLFSVTTSIGQKNQSQEGTLTSSLENAARCYSNPHTDGSCPFEDITFWLYTTSERNGTQITEDNMNRIQIDKELPWKIIYHGFMRSKDTLPGPELREAYLASGSYNVLVLDYSRPLMLYSTPLVCYTRAALTSTLLVASCSTNFLVKMIQAGVLVSLSRVHIIGHSLGAHIAGDVSARLTKQGFGRVDRVTGLDPAGPSYEGSPNITNPHKRLEPSDALFVDVYHTNAGAGLPQFGTDDRLGHVDVFFNGGTSQPGCYLNLCNHDRSDKYFAESINPLPPDYEEFVGFAVNSTVPIVVGEHISRSIRGDVNVTTNSQPPYAKSASSPPSTPASAIQQLRSLFG